MNNNISTYIMASEKLPFLKEAGEEAYLLGLVQIISVLL